VKGERLPRLAVGLAALAPVAAVAWVGAGLSRRYLANLEVVARSLRAVGIAGVPRRARLLGDGNMNAVLLVELPGGRRVVLKHMLRFGTLLGWGGRELGTMAQHPGTLGRAARFDRELAALEAFARAGVGVPAVLGANRREHVIALDYIDGGDVARLLAREPARTVEIAGQLGEMLARVHRAGYAFGDPNPRNLLVAGGRLVALDLETSHADANDLQQGFDLAWASAFLPAAGGAAMLDAYGARSRELDAAIDAAHAHLERYWPLVDLFARRWGAAA
jgi:hypothetical protein